jgi:hypothetical protein
MKTFLLKLILLAVFMYSLSYNLTFIFGKTYFLTFDQGRDLIWSYNQVLFGKPSLIGPWGSIEGIFFGPLWFWLLGLALLLSGGDPIGAALLNMIVVYAAGVVLFILLKKINYHTALVGSILFFASPYMRSLAEYPFSQHLLPLLTLGFLYFLIAYFQKKKQYLLFLSSLCVGLMFHAEPPTAMYTLIPLLFMLITKNRSKHVLTGWFIVGMGLVVTLLPLIIFDVRHDFVQTKALMSYISGENHSYSDVPPLVDRVKQRPTALFQLFLDSLVPHTTIWLGVVVLGLLAWFGGQKKVSPNSSLYLKISGFYVVSFFLIASLLPVEFKQFYLDGMMVVLMLMMAIIAGSLIDATSSKKRVLLFVVYVYLLTSPAEFVRSPQSRLEVFHVSPSIYANQSRVIDWVYQESGGNGFNAYAYVPQIYDYTYQYLFAWQGIKKYGYLPQEYSYLPGKAQYVQMKDEFLASNQKLVKPSKGMTFLIVEAGDQASYAKADWLGQFTPDKFQLIKNTYLPDGTEIRQLIPIDPENVTL